MFLDNEQIIPNSWNIHTVGEMKQVAIIGSLKLLDRLFLIIGIMDYWARATD